MVIVEQSGPVLSPRVEPQVIIMVPRATAKAIKSTVAIKGDMPFLSWEKLLIPLGISKYAPLLFSTSIIYWN